MTLRTFGHQENDNEEGEQNSVGDEIEIYPNIEQDTRVRSHVMLVHPCSSA